MHNHTCIYIHLNNNIRKNKHPCTSLTMREIEYHQYRHVEKEKATHSCILAWRIPGTGERGGLPSMGSHRVGHDWSDLAAAAAADLFKKIIDTKGTFHAKMGTIHDRNGRDPTEAEDIKRGGKNTQKNCTKKSFTTQIITMVWSLT